MRRGAEGSLGVFESAGVHAAVGHPLLARRPGMRRPHRHPSLHPSSTAAYRVEPAHDRAAGVGDVQGRQDSLTVLNPEAEDDETHRDRDTDSEPWVVRTQIAERAHAVGRSGHTCPTIAGHYV